MIPKSLQVKVRTQPRRNLLKTPSLSEGAPLVRGRRHRSEPGIFPSSEAPRQSYQFSVARLVALENFHAQWLAERIQAAGGRMDTPEMDWRAAGELISVEGHFGQEQTLNRVLKLMLAIAGNDPDRLAQARKGFHAGFVEMVGEWGEAFPEVSCRTYNAVMAKLDGWLDNLLAIPAQTSREEGRDGKPGGC